MNIGPVSAIVTCYNQAHEIETALRSVLEQNRGGDLIGEIIVVDDGSQDGSQVVIREFIYRNQDSRFRLIAQGNAGVAAARNRAMCEATGKYVAFLDGDDYWLPVKTEVQVAKMEASGAGLSYGDFLHFGLRQGRVLARRLDRPGIDALKDLFVGGGPIIPSATMLLREDALAIGGFDGTLKSLEDSDLWLRIVQRARLVHAGGMPIAAKKVAAGTRGQSARISERNFREITQKVILARPDCATLKQKRWNRYWRRVIRSDDVADRPMEGWRRLKASWNQREIGLSSFTMLVALLLSQVARRRVVRALGL